ncbi:MAG: pyruvate dehydrogenase (acetyl-transferring), homodimeric type, partial [Quisquiliibacterium sp.]
MSDHSLNTQLWRGTSVGDIDPTETADWTDSLRTLLETSGPERVRFILDRLAEIGCQPSVGWQAARGTPYVNTIPVEAQPPFPGDLAIEERLASIMR